MAPAPNSASDASRATPSRADVFAKRVSGQWTAVSVSISVIGSEMAKTTKSATPKADRRKSVNPASTTPATANGAVSISESEIARRAFEKYCARGGEHGRALDDWLQAERELRQALTASSN